MDKKGVVKTVSGNTCTVYLYDEKRDVSVAVDNVDPGEPAKHDKVSFISCICTLSHLLAKQNIITASFSIGVSDNVNISVSDSFCVRNGVSISIAVSISDSVSIGVSISISVSISDSVSIGVSISITVSISVSISVGDSISFSVSISVSIGVSTNVSFSVNFSGSISVGDSISVSVGDRISVSIGVSVSANIIIIIIIKYENLFESKLSWSLVVRGRSVSWSVVYQRIKLWRDHSITNKLFLDFSGEGYRGR